MSTAAEREHADLEKLWFECHKECVRLQNILDAEKERRERLWKQIENVAAEIKRQQDKLALT